MATSDPVRLNSFAAVFPVADVGRSLTYYLDQLGFHEYFRMPDLSYAIVELDAVSIHLMLARDNRAALGQSIIYVFADDVDALHEQLQERGCPIEVPPEDFFYGMREMSVRDPDGNRITFGQEVKKA